MSSFEMNGYQNGALTNYHVARVTIVTADYQVQYLLLIKIDHFLVNKHANIQPN